MRRIVETDIELSRRRGSLRASRDSLAYTHPLLNPGNLVPAAMLLLIVALCYKMAALGILVMLVMGCAIWIYRKSFRRFDMLFLLGIAYVMDATVTAFLFSFSTGITRTVQFLLITVAMFGFYSYAQSLDRRGGERLLQWLGVICLIILVHLIFWHLTHGFVVTWKNLLDTKLVLSLILIPLFSLEDRLKAMGRHVFPALLLLMLGVILASGERKALILFCVSFALSRLSLGAKSGLLALGLVMACGALILDEGYIYKQLSTVSDDYSHAPNRYFLSVQDIGYRSDMVRTFVNRNAWNLFLNHPALGVGATGYWPWAKGVYGNHTGLAMNVHGELARLPAEGGVLGIVIAASFFGFALWRALRHVMANGGIDAPSLDRAPLYCTAFLLCYCSVEAMDTAMLLLIASVGLVCGTLPSASINLRRGKRRFERLGGRASTPGSDAGQSAKSGALRRGLLIPLSQRK